MHQLIAVLNTLFQIYDFLIIAYCIASWFPPRKPDGWWADFCMALKKIVEPYLNLFRRFIPPVAGIDFSPIIAILVLNLIQTLLVNALLVLC